MTTPREAANTAHRAIRSLVGMEHLPLKRQEQVLADAHYAVGALEALVPANEITYTQDPQPVTPVSTSMDTNRHGYGLSEPTQAEIDAFTEAWGAEAQKIGRGIAPKGTKTRAGLRAAYAVRKQRLADAHAASVERAKHVHQERLQRIRFAREAIQASIKPKGQQYVSVLSTLIEEIAQDVETLQGSNDALRRAITDLQAELASQSSPAEAHTADQVRDIVLLELNALASLLAQPSDERPAQVVNSRIAFIQSLGRGEYPKPVETAPGEWSHVEMSAPPTLDPTPWLIVRGRTATGMARGSRFTNGDTLVTGATFRFEPRSQYEQDPHQYPTETYGKWIKSAQDDHTSDNLDPTPWRITDGGSSSLAVGDRFTDADMIPAGATFGFAPRPEFEQQAGLYPIETYGRGLNAQYPKQTIQGASIRTAEQDTLTSKIIEALRANATRLATIQEISPEDSALLRAILNELAALVPTGQDITDEDIYAERQHQISRGYSARHDDEHGLRHLLLWAIRYGKQHKTVESLALIRAALESMARQGKDL